MCVALRRIVVRHEYREAPAAAVDPPSEAGGHPHDTGNQQGCGDGRVKYDREEEYACNPKRHAGLAAHGGELLNCSESPPQQKKNPDPFEGTGVLV